MIKTLQNLIFFFFLITIFSCNNSNQITIEKIICSNYAKSFIDDSNVKNISQIGHKLKHGFNKQEVVIVPKKIEKKGFFEKLFHLFR
mgnify:CR=1 FL=1